MHELSIALSLVEAVREKADALGGVRVDAVCVRIGPLSGVVKDALMFCFDAATRGTSIEGAKLEVEEVPITVFCPRCLAEQQVPSPQHLRCPVCDEPTSAVMAGRELELAALEVTDCAPHR